MIWQVRLLAWLHIALGGLGLVVGSILCTGLAISGDAKSLEALAYVGFIFCLTLPILLPALIGGIGLLRRRSWARLTIIALSALCLLTFPVGTVLGAFGLWVLLSAPGRACFSEMTSPGTHTGSANIFKQAGLWGRRALTDRVTGLLLAMLVVAAGFILVLVAGFHLSGQAAPAALDDAVLAALLILIPAVIAGSVAIRRWRRRRKRRSAKMPTAWQALRDQRIAELESDPVKQKYAPLVARGELWSDAQIAYNEDSGMTVTCAHLQMIERDLRLTGIKMKRASSIIVSAQCRIDQVALEHRYHLTPPAHYSEFYQGDRSSTDFPTAMITCGDCHSSISVLHPDQARVETPVFPPAAQ
jgi:membrane protein implicated in regulation of membrane protease activity